MNADSASREVKSQIVTPSPQDPDTKYTLNDLLMAAESAENSREHNRRVIDQVAARSSTQAHWMSFQVAALNSHDQWAQVPAALWLRGYVNREFGQDFTPQTVRFIRGRVCEACDIDTASAGRMTLGQVVEALKRAETPAEIETDDSLFEFRWISVSDVSRAFGINTGTISRAADEGKLVTNGKKGYHRRIDVLSVIRWQLERSDRKQPAESDVHVENLLRKANEKE